MRRVDHLGFSAGIKVTSQDGECEKSVILSGRELSVEIQLYAAAGLHIRYNLFRYRQTGAFVSSS
jgi:hypothetical protein